MTEFVSFFVVLLAAVFFSALFNRLHLPWVIALISAGIAIGPFGFDIFEPDATIMFLGEIGLIFLMFMAGLETRLSSIAKNGKGITELAVANGLLPAVVGFGIALAFGYSTSAAMLLGIIFISTSIAVVIPSLEVNGILKTRVGGLLVGATIIEDVASLFVLSVLLQVTAPTTSLSLPVYYLLLGIILVALRFTVPKIRVIFHAAGRQQDLFQQEIRLILVLLVGVVIIFQLLGLHPIIAGFFAGVVLSESITSRALREKIRAVSYGIFIPIFFVLIGTKTNLRVFSEAGLALWLSVAIVVGSVGAKFISGYLAARLQRFTTGQSFMIGAATTPSLSTTLAVAFTGLEIGLLDQKMVTALVLLSILTVIIGPGIIALLAKRAAKETVLQHPG